jgi:hypothetical protein
MQNIHGCQEITEPEKLYLKHNKIPEMEIEEIKRNYK